jgi:hypothetical protein
MFIKYIFGLSFLLFNLIYSFNFKFYNNNKIDYLNMMKPNDMISYLTSIKDYTIITVGDDNKDIEELMYKNNMKVYYVNLDNIFDKIEIIEILKKNYKNINSSEYLWVFYRGFFMGSREDINKIIENKQKNDFI